MTGGGGGGGGVLLPIFVKKQTVMLHTYIFQDFHTTASYCVRYMPLTQDG